MSAVHFWSVGRSGEMADAADSKSAGATRESSNLSSGTRFRHECYCETIIGLVFVFMSHPWNIVNLFIYY